MRDERPQLPDSFVRTVEKALSREPSERFRSAGAFEEALRAQQPPAPVPDPPLPWEVWIIALVARIGLWMGGIVLVLLTLGFLTSNAFNVTFGRPAEFAGESVGDWFLWGVRVVTPPIIYMTLYAIPLLLLFLLWKLLKLVPPVANHTSRIISRIPRRLGEPAVLSSVLVAFGLVALIAVCWSYADLIFAVGTPISEVEREAVSSLSPDNIDSHIAFGQLLDAILFALGIGSYRVFRLARASGTSAVKPLAGVMALMVVTLFLWVFPYRILWQNQFEKVRFGEERAYIIGKKGDELLIHRPDASPPRNRIVSTEDAGLVRLQIRESVFEGPEQN